jgi:hypothetical protein
MALGSGREASFAGSGFFIAATHELGIAITAKHVLLEGVARAQRPWSSHVLSSPFVSQNSVELSLNPEKLKIVWMGE